jgi:secondary thiamine-phosphate synthase enzyme
VETLAPHATFWHTTIRIDTEQPLQFIDVTDALEMFLTSTGVDIGLLNIQSLHTTTAILVNEHEPLLLTDIAALLERVAPEGNTYRHDNVGLRSVNCVLGERPNGHSHCRALLMGASIGIHVANGCLQLGRWQRVLFVELDGPRSRQVSVLVSGAGR